ncbi:hypothetical protein ACFX13_015444 [Malus domestica]
MRPASGRLVSKDQRDDIGGKRVEVGDGLGLEERKQLFLRESVTFVPAAIRLSTAWIDSREYTMVIFFAPLSEKQLLCDF